MYQGGYDALRCAQTNSRQPVVAYLSAAEKTKRHRAEEDERKQREQETEVKRRREEEQARKQHEQKIIVELGQLCQADNGSAVRALLVKELASTIATVSALAPTEVLNIISFRSPSYRNLSP